MRRELGGPVFSRNGSTWRRSGKRKGSAPICHVLRVFPAEIGSGICEGKIQRGAVAETTELPFLDTEQEDGYTKYK
jgi:hypothetical protein